MGTGTRLDSEYRHLEIAANILKNERARQLRRALFKQIHSYE